MREAAAVRFFFLCDCMEKRLFGNFRDPAERAEFAILRVGSMGNERIKAIWCSEGYGCLLMRRWLAVSRRQRLQPLPAFLHR